MDLFASGINTRLPRYVSWLPDPDPWVVGASNQDRAKLTLYRFQHFNLFPNILRRLETRQMAFRQRLKTLSSQLGEAELKSATTPTANGGYFFM